MHVACIHPSSSSLRIEKQVYIMPGSLLEEEHYSMVLTPQGKKFSDQVAALEASVKALKANNSQLAEDLKAATNTIRAKDRELDAAFKKVAAAEQTEVRNKVGRQDCSAAEKGWSRLCRQTGR